MTKSIPAYVVMFFPEDGEISIYKGEVIKEGEKYLYTTSKLLWMNFPRMIMHTLVPTAPGSHCTLVYDLYTASMLLSSHTETLKAKWKEQIKIGEHKFSKKLLELNNIERDLLPMRSNLIRLDETTPPNSKELYEKL